MALLVILGRSPVLNRVVFSVPKQNFSVLQISRNQIKNRPILRYLTQKRNFFSFLRRPTKQQIRIKDQIPDSYELIYRNTSERIITIAQVFTTFSTIIVVGIAVVKSDFKDTQEFPFSGENMLENRPREVQNESLIYVGFFIVTLVILQLFISQMPQRIYYNGQLQKYWLVFNSNIPFTTRKVPLKVGQIRHAPGGISPWKGDRYEIKNGQKLLLMESYFRRPADLYIMMGVQKDPDLENDK